jgi:hypothetical protein
MTISYGRGAPKEQVTLTVTENGKTRTYRAVQGSGMHYDVVDAQGVTHRSGISNCRSKFDAVEGLRMLAKRDHDDGLVNRRTAAIRDRVVGVDLGGNYSASEITGGRRG